MHLVPDKGARLGNNTECDREVSDQAMVHITNLRRNAIFKGTQLKTKVYHSRTLGSSLSQ